MLCESCSKQEQKPHFSGSLVVCHAVQANMGRALSLTVVHRPLILCEFGNYVHILTSVIMSPAWGWWTKWQAFKTIHRVFTTHCPEVQGHSNRVHAMLRRPVPRLLTWVRSSFFCHGIALQISRSVYLNAAASRRYASICVFSTPHRVIPSLTYTYSLRRRVHGDIPWDQLCAHGRQVLRQSRPGTLELPAPGTSSWQRHGHFQVTTENTPFTNWLQLKKLRLC